MKANIKGYEVSGTPEEIAQFVIESEINHKDQEDPLTLEPCEYCKWKEREYTPECELNK